MSRADLAEACGISTAAVGKWLNNETTDIKLDNFFAIASLMMVNPRWLGTGNDTPFTGIPSIYKDIPGAYLKVAKDLAEVGDKRLNSTVGELIAAKRSTGGKKPQRKKGEAIRAS